MQQCMFILKVNKILPNAKAYVEIYKAAQLEDSTMVITHNVASGRYYQINSYNRYWTIRECHCTLVRT